MTVYRRIERFADPQTSKTPVQKEPDPQLGQRHHSGDAIHLDGVRAARVGSAMDEDLADGMLGR